MHSNLSAVLLRDDIVPIASEYLRTGRKQDEWEITRVDVDGGRLKASVRMMNYYRSPTDGDSFHLTSFSTLEFVSQLFIIYGHVLAGRTKKSQEAWMLESSIVCSKAVRDPDNIQVEMDVELMKKVRARMLGTAKARVFDGAGGLFLVEIKALLA